MPCTWRTVYLHGISSLNSVKPKEAFDSSVVHTMNWTNGWLLQFYASQLGVHDPQPPGVWELWATAAPRSHATNFVPKVLWKKVAGPQTSSKALGHGQLPGLWANRGHTRRYSRLHYVQGGVGGYSALFWSYHVRGERKEAAESFNQEWSLQSSQGLAMWLARRAHWRYRCEVKAGATLTFTSLLTTWFRIVSGWVPFFQGDCKRQWHKFLHSIDRLTEPGVQPNRGEVQPATGLS